jgi:hypothetical protein
MNTEQLARKLRDLGVRSDAYELRGGLPSEAYCLGQSGDQWEIYYSERGQKTARRFFSSEDEACRALLEWLLKDTSVTSGAART